MEMPTGRSMGSTRTNPGAFPRRRAEPYTTVRKLFLPIRSYRTEMDIVVTATTSKEPVFKGEWLSRGTHINAIGANFLSKQEIDAESVSKSACVVVDSCEQAMLESGDLDFAAKADAFYWEDARELGLVVVGEYPGREDAKEITLFESQGIALEDVAIAARIYEQALKEGLGQTLPF